MIWPKKDAHIKLRKNARVHREASVAISVYLQWVESDSLRNMQNNHEVISAGLIKLANALEALEKSNTGISETEFDNELEIVRTNAALITANTDSDKHAQMLKDAFLASAGVLAELQVLSFPRLEDDVDDLNEKISKFKGDAMTLNQKEQLKDIFSQTAVVLNRMDEVEEASSASVPRTD